MAQRILYYLTPLLKLLLFVLFIMLGMIPFELIREMGLFSSITNSFIAELTTNVILILVVLCALLMIFKTFKNVNFATVFVVRQNALSAFFKGSLIGLGLISCCAGLTLLNGNVVFNMGSISPAMFIGYLLFFIGVAVFEELIFRSYPLFVFAERYPIIITVLLNGILFGLAHLANPGFTWLAMLNITLVGILFSMLVLQKKNISWAIGIHFGWNFAQGILLGYKVSGTNSLGLLSAKPIGSVYLSGGSFGIESSIFCTAILLIVIVYFAFCYRITPIEESIFEEET